MIRYHIKSLLIVALTAAILFGWYTDRTRLAIENESLHVRVRQLEARSTLAGNDFFARRRAIKSLVDKSDAQSLALLLYGLTDSDPVVRATAYSALRSKDRFVTTDSTTIGGNEVAKSLERYFGQSESASDVQ
ncbi:hypothetical protein Q31b_58430 [Novipirellula aureliae]|uniref:HEAT repeat protein n=1 Tax=Novipirellula aureliae TaxID=2527966 RepID=A0A5C6D5K0_9BACT|nr:hypothetical protein Q31b_58430 [Novipirellula aureliae]